ncbi:MAG: imidazole glycerol phosphate synthase subunit HisH [Deltaproteobacteria bacterium]
MIAIVDYGMGNLRSVAKAFEMLGVSVCVTRDAGRILDSDGLVVPGVGAFGDCMNNLSEFGLAGPIREYALAGKPFLGICLGLQLLFDGSEESPGVSGLGILGGRVVRFEKIRSDLKIPHMGWNRVLAEREIPMLTGIPSGSRFYFVHSFYAQPEDSGLVALTTGYGVQFASAVQRGNLFACQFHPEKSGPLGLRVLENFALLCGEASPVKALRVR